MDFSESRHRFTNQVAVVTGAASGIGRAIATRLAEEDADVVAFDRNEAGVAELADELGDKGHNVTAVKGDVTDTTDLDRAVTVAGEQYGSAPQLVVANAGEQTFNSIWDLEDAEWDQVMRTNVWGTFLTLRTFAAAMKAEGTNGSMVTISSVKGRSGAPLYPHYSASKAGVLSLTRSFALELASDGIRVNTVAPGAVRTPLWEKASHEMGHLLDRDPLEMRAERETQIPLGRFAEPEDITGAVTYLLSSDAAYLTGECIHVSGGDLML